MPIVRLSDAVKTNLYRLDKRLVFVFAGPHTIIPAVDSPPDTTPTLGTFRNFEGREPPVDSKGFLSLLRGFFSPGKTYIDDQLLFECSRGFRDSWHPNVVFWDSWKMESLKPACASLTLGKCYISEFTHELIGTPFGPGYGASPRARRAFPHKCYCGAPALVLSSTIECTDPKCRHYTFDDSGVG